MKRFSREHRQATLGILAVMLVASALTRCTVVTKRILPSTQVTRARYLMGTTLSITTLRRSTDAAERAFAEVARVEGVVSTWREDTELARLNRAPVAVPQTLSRELFSLLRNAMEIAHQTGGTFNPLSGRLLDAWGIREGGRVPGDQLRSEAIALARLDSVTLNDSALTVTRLRDCRFEEGGFAKGFALDLASAAMRNAGALSAVLDFGGQVTLFGFEQPVEIAIAHPEARDAVAVTLQLRSGSLSTSSGSERNFTGAGRKFSHLIDPRNGEALPPRGSVSVIHDSSLIADALSTALYVMGPGEGISWANSHDVAAIFLVPSLQAGNYDVFISAPLRKRPVDLHLVAPNFFAKD